jgi:CRISPR-associated exonuclease Cas4
MAVDDRFDWRSTFGDGKRGFKPDRATSRSRMPTFTELGRAAYCPRQLYYARRDGDDGPSPEARARQRLAYRYAELRDASDRRLRDEPIALSPAAYRTALGLLAERDDWAALVDPSATEVTLAGKDCRGRVHKLLDTGSGTVPSLVSPGAPPEQGVWEPQRVRAVAAAKALSWEREATVDRALVEYPAHGVVRTVRLTTRARATYRRALRAVRSLDGPPPRLRDTAKCEPCDYRDRCGVPTRSMRSLLGR